MSNGRARRRARRTIECYRHGEPRTFKTLYGYQMHLRTQHPKKLRIFKEFMRHRLFSVNETSTRRSSGDQNG